jgi:ElaA protein
MSTWHCKSFSQLSSNELYAILQARQNVFIIEQNCLYADIDQLDLQCLHLFFSTTSDDKIATIHAYLRIVPPGVAYNEASLGRVLVSEDSRSQGLAKILINKGLDELKLLYPQQPIKIAAQNYLLAFYQSLGFSKISDIYLDDGIEHIDMLLSQ